MSSSLPSGEAAARSAGSESAVVRWWRSLGRAQRVVATVLGVVVVANLTLTGVESTIGGSEPGGPISSSFSTGERGLEGYADLAGARGHRVTRLREPLTPNTLTPTGPDETVTVVIADAGASDGGTPMTEEEVQTLVDFVREGGRLVLTGPTSWPLVQRLTGDVLTASYADPAAELTAWLEVPDLGGALILQGDEGLRWDSTGSLTPVVGAGTDPAVLVGSAGRGRLVVVADGVLLHNRNLNRADNAAFGLGLLGDPGAHIVFVESIHGFGRTGLDAVPSSWKWTALAMALVVVMGLWSAGTRFGPPEPDRRVLRPPRQDHVDALAAGLHRVTPDAAEAAAPLVDRLRADVADDLRQPVDASDAVLRRAAEGTDAETTVNVVVNPEPGARGALAVGALAARRQRTRWGFGATSSEPARTTTSDSPPPDTLPTRPSSGADK